jgi:hypothetical protein
MRAPLVVGKAPIVDLAAFGLHVRYTPVTRASTDSAEERGKNICAPCQVDVLAFLIRVRTNLGGIRASEEKLATPSRGSVLAKL